MNVVPEYPIPLFDRLSDYETEHAAESKPYNTYKESQLIQSIQKELYNILNTRSCAIPYGIRTMPEDFLDPTISNGYGLPDFMNYDVTNDDGWHLISNQIQRTIELYEPRLTNISIIIKGLDSRDQRLMVEIRGALHVNPLGQRFSFPVTIEPMKTC